jgi:outer membrane protein TolC
MRGLAWLGIGMLISLSAVAEEPIASPKKDEPPKVLELPVTQVTAPKAQFAEAQLQGQSINLATALKLAGAQAVDVNLAAAQIEIAAASYRRAQVLWLPNIALGGDYFHHEGVVQNFEGITLNRARSSLMAGIGANAVFGLSDAIFAPLAARQDLAIRFAQSRTAQNNVAFEVADAFFRVQQNRGEYNAATQLVTEGEDLSRRTEKLAEGIAPPVEATRARVELARRKQLALLTKERWQVASAELARLLRLQPTTLFAPEEPPEMAVCLFEAGQSVDELVTLGLTQRPELEANQAFVQATLARLRQEKIRPLVPSVLLRSVSTNPSGSLGYGIFGGGPNGNIGNYNSRFDYDVQLIWELQNLGLGNRARVQERNGEHQVAQLELLKLQDQVAAEVAMAHAQVEGSYKRLRESESAYADALDSFKKNREGMSQTRRVGNVLILVVRPSEAVAALQALATAATDYYAAIADFNRAQFRLLRATGSRKEAKY